MSAQVQLNQIDFISLSKNLQTLWKNLHSFLFCQKRRQTRNDECAVSNIFNNYSFYESSNITKKFSPVFK